MKLFTIGFTQKNAERFFTLLKNAGVRRVIDTRLNNRSQLAGFSKGEDLPFFLSAIGNMEYRHALEMAPTQEMLDKYKKAKGSWSEYEHDFIRLLESRELAARVSLEELDGACLLCSEHKPEQCHRRLVAEFLRVRYPQIEITHLL
jgi:uncharacterized protein (DUF488 family)